MSDTVITGTIFSDTNGNGVQDAGEPGILGYDMIAIDYATQAVTTATTDDTGMYTFENVAPAPATTLVQAGYFPSGTTVVDPSTSWYRYITPQENSIVTFDVGFYPVPQSELTDLRVTVYEDANRNGQRDAGESGMPGIDIVVYTYTIGGPILTTNADGVVMATPVPTDFIVYIPDMTGYTPTAYNYMRSDAATTLGMYNPNDLVADEPAPSSMHTMEIGLVPVSVNHAQLVSTVKINSADIEDISNPTVNASFGASATNIGDIDGDRIDDFVVGDPGEIGSANTGNLHVMLMNSDGSIKNTTEINSQTPNGPNLAAGDRFGVSVANIGDLDGDGVNDLAVGAPSHLVGGTGTGDVFLIFMNSDGSIKNTTEINSQTPNGPSLAAGDRFGTSVAGLGDIDGDSVDDLAVGAPGRLVGGTGTGDVFLIFMNSDGSIKNTTEINSQTPNGPNLAAGDRFGESVANIGDLDGDGVDDLAVGAPGHAIGGTGDVFLMLMNSDGTIKNTTEINSQTPNGPNLAAGANFGRSIAGLGDLDGDSVVDLAIGSPSIFGDPHTGDVFLIFMNSNGSIKNTTEINAQIPNGPSLAEGDRFGVSIAVGDIDGDNVNDLVVGTLATDILYIMFMNSDGSIKNTTEIDSPSNSGLEASGHFGVSVANIGDFDNDGVVDLAIGSTGQLGETVTGHVFLIFMNSDGSVKNTIEINTETPNGPSLAEGDRFGTSIAGLGDLDGDGVVDLAVSAPDNIITGVDTGDVFLMFMNSDGTIKNTTEINSQTPNGPSLAAGDRFGESVANIGDLDGDGVIDLAVGAPSHLVGGAGTGDVFLMFMNSDGSVKNTIEINTETPNGPLLAEGDRFGTSIAGLGDLDGDGVEDLAVGAPGHLVGGAGTGDVFLMFMNSDGSVKNTTEINSQTPNGPSLAAGDRFGVSIANIGDLDGDGVIDLAIGATGHIFDSTGTGDIFLIFLNSDGSVKDTAEINAQTPNGPNLEAGDRFGTSMAGLGDLDGDGGVEIAAGAPFSRSVHVMFTSVN